MNPRSLRFMAACCRHAAASETDASRREALEGCAGFIERSAEARDAIKAVLAIYEVWPEAQVSEVRKTG